MRSTYVEKTGRKKVRLGAVTDGELFRQLCEQIKTLNGTIDDVEWDMGPSRQTTTYLIKLPDGQLHAMADTEDGLFLEGDERLVSLLVLSRQQR